ncbi:HAD-IA family hydrolase [Rhizorhapis sp.]|uniref:HAD-IA family hydrolase n=1 Tax=Rhizorhapis sp. TaxID=1968842 RepID=UPI002B48D829|nr:HAD-IA family hydrolase [Rhizorhapis sp.]HKR17597.1 HAD-IA family hydrolase [Rhizorhapis sp.]HKX35389.1 HAD-IA family hydrolase [Rhizorhapis sp.]
MNRLAIFDCDGTLVDSQHNICTAMDRAFEAVKLPPPPRYRTLAVVGLSLPEAMAVLLPDAEADFHLHVAQQYKQVFQAMRGAGLVHEPLFEGIADLVDRLDREGWLLGVATGKSDRGLQLCLSHHGLVEKFVTLQTADRHPSKPHPSMIEQAMADAGAVMESTIMIGDTSFDMEMAVNARTRGLGVGWGYHAPEELIASGAFSVAVDADELYRHIADHD